MQNLTMSILPFIAIMALMYFMLIRPQQKQQKKLQSMRESLKIGDLVITIGGIKGKILKVTDDSVILETSNAKTRMEFVKQAISTVVNKTEDGTSNETEDTAEDESEE